MRPPAGMSEALWVRIDAPQPNDQDARATREATLTHPTGGATLTSLWGVTRHFG